MTSDSTLQRFIDAQKSDYTTALAEIESGKKRSHWMWYIFPQIAGLGVSQTARYYALKDTAEALEFIKHPVLGSRLIHISNALLKLKSNDAYAILSSPDDMKLKSCITLFAVLPAADPVFQQVLEKFYRGEHDDRTLGLLGRMSAG